MTSPTATLPAEIRVIDDLHLGDPHIIATYLLPGDEPAIIDPGPATVIPTLEAGLRANGVEPADLRAIVLTHIHLDHAGATGSLVARYPKLRVYVHQRGAPHLIAPEKLLRSATRIYGEEMDRLWGEFLAVPEANITALTGGETIALGGRRLRVFDAPGHASHHLAYFEDASGVAFVGDSTGVRMPGFSYARPATAPPDIDLEGWNRTLDLLLSLDPGFVAPTHFGAYSDAAGHIERYRERLMAWAEFVRAGLESGADEESQVERLRALSLAEVGPSPAAQSSYQHAAGVEMNWSGLARYWRSRE